MLELGYLAAPSQIENVAAAVEAFSAADGPETSEIDGTAETKGTSLRGL